MQRTRLLGSILLTGLLTATLAGCGGDSADPSNADPKANAVNGADSGGSDDSQPGGDDLGAGSAWIEVDGDRYETRELNCHTDFGGADFAGTAEGPRPNARIHGRFGTSMPDLIAVSFARGDEGEFRALAENELVPHGVLEDYTFDLDALRMGGAAEFGWVDEEGVSDLDNLHPGTFQVNC